MSHLFGGRSPVNHFFGEENGIYADRSEELQTREETLHVFFFLFFFFFFFVTSK